MNAFIKVIFMVMLSITFVGCAAIGKSAQESLGYGQVTTDISEFDGSTSVTMSQTTVAYLPNSKNKSGLNVRHKWLSNDPSFVSIQIVVNNYIDFAPIRSVAINIDGEIIYPKEVSPTTDLSYQTNGGVTSYTAVKTYLIPMDTLRAISSSKTNKVLIQVYTDNDKLVNDMKREMDSLVSYPQSLREFVSAVDKVTQTH